MRRNRTLWILLIVFFLIFLGTEIYLPGIATRRLVDIFEQETEDIQQLDVNIASFPALKIFLGRVDHVSIRSQGLLFDDLYVERFNLNYRNIVLSKDSFEGVNTYFEALVTQDALNDYLKEKYPELGTFLLEINPEQILLQGEIKVLQASFNLQLSGNLLVNDKNQIYFVPDNFQVEDINIPVNFLKSYIEGLAFVIDLQTLDIPLNVDEIQIGPEYILITGEEKDGDVNE